MSDQVSKEAVKSGIQFAVASLLGFIFYNHFDLTFGFWCVITIAAVLQPTVKMTINKAFMRLLGTLIGVIFSYLAVLIILSFPSTTLIIFFVVMFASACLIFYYPEHSYTGVVCGITAIIILTTYNQKPMLLHDVIINRSIDVIVGILIAWVCSTLIFPSKSPEMQIPPQDKLKTPLLDAFIMALATTLSLLPWFYFHYQGGFWAPIACLFIVQEHINKSYQKSFEFFLSHVIVMIIAGLLSFSFDTVYGLGISLVLGMFIFGYWMKKPILNLSYTTANAMAVVYCVVLLINPGSINTLNTIMARFFNTIIGIVIGLLLVSLRQWFKKPNPS